MVPAERRDTTRRVLSNLDWALVQPLVSLTLEKFKASTQVLQNFTELKPGQLDASWLWKRTSASEPHNTNVKCNQKQSAKPLDKFQVVCQRLWSDSSELEQHCPQTAAWMHRGLTSISDLNLTSKAYKCGCPSLVPEDLFRGEPSICELIWEGLPRDMTSTVELRKGCQKKPATSNSSSRKSDTLSGLHTQIQNL